ncbi:MAG TPA: hypothetical protein VLK34_05000 [Nocardioidaceae bacterium]|nr:hypothetical protein [Nocardioidaceae bacterium]
MPAKRIYLHIGAPKTGTTYLQALCGRNRDVLAAHGIVYPEAFGDAHHKAVWDLRETPDQREGTKGIEGSWERLAGLANDADSDVLLSSEHFVFAVRRQIDRAVSSFDGELHVIYTARDLVRQVPAVWQERIKNQKTVAYHDFVRSVIDGSGPGAKSFWGAQDAGRALDRWSGSATGISPDRVHVVTAPPTGSPRTLLWDRFSSVIGLAGVEVDTSADSAANESLSMLQTELLRRYNERHAEGVPWPQYRRIMRRQLDVLTAIDDGRKVALAPDEHAFFSARAREICDAVATAGYQVVGDLADLIPVAQRSGAGGDDPTELSEAELLAASLDVVHQLLISQADAKRAARQQSRQAARKQARNRPS